MIGLIEVNNCIAYQGGQINTAVILHLGVRQVGVEEYRST